MLEIPIRLQSIDHRSCPPPPDRLLPRPARRLPLPSPAANPTGWKLSQRTGKATVERAAAARTRAKGATGIGGVPTAAVAAARAAVRAAPVGGATGRSLGSGRAVETDTRSAAAAIATATATTTTGHSTTSSSRTSGSYNSGGGGVPPTVFTTVATTTSTGPQAATAAAVLSREGGGIAGGAAAPRGRRPRPAIIVSLILTSVVMTEFHSCSSSPLSSP